MPNKNLEGLLRIKPKENFEELCSGCGLCEAYCHAYHFDTEGKKKSAIKISGKNFPIPGGYECTVCNQCGKCLSKCPEEAIFKDGKIIKIDYSICTGCEELESAPCIEACPTNAIFKHPEERYPIKCDGCGECVEICPLEALEYKFSPKKGGKK